MGCGDILVIEITHCIEFHGLWMQNLLFLLCAHLRCENFSDFVYLGCVPDMPPLGSWASIVQDM